MSALLEVRSLSVDYETFGVNNHVLSDVSLHLEGGEVVGIVGESGSGKSTLALALLGLTRPRAHIRAGSVSISGRELLGLPPDGWQSIRGAEIGLITQNPRGSLNPTMRIGDQISAVYRSHTSASSADCRAAALDALRLVGMNDPERRYAAYPHELSGGMAQRTVIAAAVVCRPKIVVADEPTTGLDVTIQAQILDDLARTVSEVRSALLLVTQDLGIVANYCDRVYAMHAGEVIEDATTVAFFAEPTHPASIALLSAQIGLTSQSYQLRGLPVDGRRLPGGCWLEPRCPFAESSAGCATVHPELREISAGHVVRCHRAETIHAQIGVLHAAGA